MKGTGDYFGGQWPCQNGPMFQWTMLVTGERWLKSLPRDLVSERGELEISDGRLRRISRSQGNLWTPGW